MLPFDRKPWAKAVATLVIVASCLGAAGLAFYWYNDHSLRIPEIVGLGLLLLILIPPNAAIVLRKPGQTDPLAGPSTLSHTPR